MVKWLVIGLALSGSCHAQQSNSTLAPTPDSSLTPSSALISGQNPSPQPATKNFSLATNPSPGPADASPPQEAVTSGPVEDGYDFSCPLPSKGRYADDGFCETVCVESENLCPSELVCDTGKILCPDGLCYAGDDAEDVCVDFNNTNASACADFADCGLPFACRRDVNDTCAFAKYYAAQDACAEEPPAEYLPTTVAGFLFVCLWIPCLAILTSMFTLFNQRVCPKGTPRSVRLSAPGKDYDTKEVPLEEKGGEDTPLTTKPEGEFIAEGCVVQTGYKYGLCGLFGQFIFLLLLLTFFGFHVILIILTMGYYAVTSDYVGPIYILNEYQVLAWFIFTWHVASIYTIVIMYPSHLRFQFLRRTHLKSAEYVEVWQPEIPPDNQDMGSKLVAVLYLGVQYMFLAVDWVMGLIFWEARRGRRGRRAYCPVRTTEAGLKIFTYQLRQFVLAPDQDCFMPAKISLPSTCDGMVRLGSGLSEQEVRERFDLMGPNLIAVPPPSIAKELVREFSRGFYIYQTFMAWTWFNFGYWHMGILLWLVFSVGGFSVVWVNYQNAVLLAKLIGKPSTVKVMRGGERKDVTSDQLVSGDVVEVPAGEMSCDMLLIQGRVVLDESSLTGESLPVAKEAIEDRPEKLDLANTHRKNVILAGTVALQGDDAHPSRAIVLQTGGNSEKGLQIRDILFRPPPHFKFQDQVLIVVVILGGLAIAGAILTVHFLGDKPQEEAWFYAMYVVASALPPLLPTVFVVSVGLSSQRLLKHGVLCSEPARLLMAGKVRVCCFDKTGTLTKQGMDFFGVREVKDGVIGSIAPVTTESMMDMAMATCHGLATYEGKKGEGPKLLGNAVDITMFEATGWRLESDTTGRQQVKKGDQVLTKVHTFTFDRHRMTSGVIVHAGGHFVAFKGSVEAVARICDRVPPNFLAVGDELAAQGCYTMAIASRPCTQAEEAAISSHGVPERDGMENGLTCLGFLVFKNAVKHDSEEALRLLREGAVRTVMITGDHPLTALKIASELKLIPTDARVLRGTQMTGDAIVWTDQATGTACDLPLDNELHTVELAVSGMVFRAIRGTALLDKLLTHIRVFARTTPDDKVSVVRMFIGAGFTTAMCGDGGNDCGALRAAHVGVALSDAEASVVSPFTGVSKSAMAMVHVLLEGRCGLASAFACYKNVVMYGLVETLNQILNAYFAITFSEWNWVMLDGAWIMSTSFALATARPLKTLAGKRPPSSPLGLITVSACVGMIIIHGIFLGIAMGVLANEPWYQCRQWDPNAADIGDLTGIGDNYESSVIWIITGAQMLHNAAAFNFGHVHRTLWIFNWKLVLLLIGFYTFHVVVTLYPSSASCIFRINCRPEDIVYGVLEPTVKIPIGNDWNTTLMPMSFRGKLCAIMLGNLIAACLWEYLVIIGPVGNLLRRQFPHTKHLRL